MPVLLAGAVARVSWIRLFDQCWGELARYSINTLHDETIGDYTIKSPLETIATSRAGGYIGFRGALNGAVASVSSYNLYLYGLAGFRALNRHI